MPELFQDLPALLLAIATTIFVTGFILADLSNPTSWLRRWLRWRFRLFDLVSLIPPSVGVVDNVDYVTLRAKIKFVRNVQKASLILEIDGIMANDGSGSRYPATIVLQREKTFLSGEEVSIDIATIPVASYHNTPLGNGWFGPLGGRDRIHGVCEGSTNHVTIQVSTDRRAQGYKVYLKKIGDYKGAHGKMFFMGEDYDAFGTTEGPAFR